MATNVVGGIEKIEYAAASLTGVVSVWKPMPNVAVGSVLHTKNIGTKSTINKEDGKRAFINIFAPAEGDLLTIGLLSQDIALIQELFSVEYDEETTTVEYFDEDKIANLAIKITCSPMKDGRKCIIIFYNTDVQTGYANNLTFDQVQQLALTASLGTYRKAGDAKDKVYSKQWVLANGTVIDSSTP
jgi:hypothetical protein